jgi:hypothetical protein
MSLKEIILINSANFDFARVKLDKDLFFLGDNGSGKTSFIRAIHFLYSGDIKTVGIPNDKEGFKEYYFKHEDSYIIYVFDEFFILMYKASNDIVKIFSAQKFDINKIKDGDKLKDAKEIRAYAKNKAYLGSAKRGVSEYSDILYGLDKKYLDFKIASIQNKDTFLKLFHSVFNIDKAIIDSKSIKKALFTSLNAADESQFFDPNEYILQINTYSSELKFIKEIEKNESNIQKAYELKNSILKAQEYRDELSSYIAYRIEYEKRQKIETQAQIELLQEKREQLSIKKSRLVKIKNRFDEKIAHKINDTKYNLEAIDKLKQKFEPHKIAKAKELILQEHTTKQVLEQTTEQLIKLQKGYESAYESIAKEIERLQYTLNTTLKVEQETLLQQRYNELEAKMHQKIQNKEVELEKHNNLKNEQISKHNHFVTEASTKIQSLKESILQYKHELSLQEIESIKQEQYLYKEKEQEIQSKEEKIASLLHQSDRLKREKNAKVAQYKKSSVILKTQYTTQKDELTAQRDVYDNMIKTQEGSFKEFLQENVELWEEKLYPVLDAELLDMPQSVLKPKLNAQNVLNLDIDTTTLKKILPYDEALNRIKQIDQELSTLSSVYKERLYSQKVSYKESLLELKYKQESIVEQINSLKDTIVNIEKQYQNKVEKLKNDLATFKASIDEKIEKANKSILAFQEEASTNRAKIKNLQKEIQAKKQEFARYKEEQKRTLLNQKERTKQELSKEFATKKEEIQTQIQEYKNKQSQISNDERIQKLIQEQETLQAKQLQIQKAKLYIQEYEESQSYIAKKPEYETLLNRCNLLKRSYTARYKTTIQTLQEQEEVYKKETESFKSKLQKIQNGLSCAVEMKLLSPKQTDAYLYELIAKYEKVQQQIGNETIKLKSILQKLNTIKGLRKYDIYFDISLFDRSDRLSELEIILINIDNVLELQATKITTLKKTLSTSFENFVKATVSRKLDIFSSAKEDFIKLVAKINKNLSSVDFGVIKDIRLESSLQEQDSLAKMLTKLREKMLDISTLFNKDSLFFDAKDSKKSLDELEVMFATIKKELKSDRISLIDTIDLHLSFKENNKQIISKSQIKNESSTGGSMLLKIAIAISILQVYIRQSKGVFFLIVDEVARLHSSNQQKLKAYANSAGFKIIFVTPEPVFANAKELKYYKFVKNDDKFLAIELNR